MTPFKLTFVLALVSILVVPLAGQDDDGRPPKAASRPRPDETEFIRYNKGTKVARLETASVTYENVDTGKKVVLVSCVHVADGRYYEDIQKRLAGFDVVLFEGVSANAKDKPAEELLWVTRLQLTLKDYLGLEYQRDHIDYAAKNFAHADLTAAEVETKLKENGVDLIPFAPVMKGLGPIVETGLKFLAQATKDSESPTLHLMRGKMKTTMAGFLGNGLRIYERFKRDDEKKRDLVVIAARNDVVLAKLDDVFQKTDAKNVAVFYGAAHMPDLAGNLIQRYGMKKSGVEWLAAWTISLDAEKPAEDPVESSPTSAPTSNPRRRI